VIVGNKVCGEEDRRFIAEAFPDTRVSAFLPYSEKIRRADRDGLSALSGMGPSERSAIEGIMEEIRRGMEMR